MHVKIRVACSPSRHRGRERNNTITGYYVYIFSDVNNGSYNVGATLSNRSSQTGSRPAPKGRYSPNWQTLPLIELQILRVRKIRVY